MTRILGPFLIWLVAFLASPTLAQDEETQEPDYNCIGGPAFGLEAACDFNSFEGLDGHPASEVLYEIIMQARFDNDTFYENDQHISCLFADTNFILDFGVGAGGVEMGIEIDHPGTICAFVTDVPEGGLSLGEIRALARALIGECGHCGRMTVNYLSQNESQLGWLEFDWRNNPICQENCIDPETDLVTANSTEGGGDDDEDDGAPGAYGSVSRGVTAGLLGLWVAFFVMS